MKSKIISFFLVGILLAASVNADRAAEYFGFGVGTQTLDQVNATLKKSGARFENYDPYERGDELPVLKVESYPRFDKYGRVREAFLRFTPTKILYEFSVTWFGDHKLFEMLRDALNTKYGATCGALSLLCEYRDRNVDIVLSKGVVKNDLSLTYTFKPGLQEVQKMKERIRDEIRKKHAKDAASDI